MTIFVLFLWLQVRGDPPTGLTSATFASEDACKAALAYMGLYGPNPLGSVHGLCVSAQSGKPPGYEYLPVPDERFGR